MTRRQAFPLWLPVILAAPGSHPARMRFDLSRVPPDTLYTASRGYGEWIARRSEAPGPEMGEPPFAAEYTYTSPAVAELNAESVYQDLSKPGTLP